MFDYNRLNHLEFWRSSIMQPLDFEIEKKYHILLISINIQGVKNSSKQNLVV